MPLSREISLWRNFSFRVSRAGSRYGRLREPVSIEWYDDWSEQIVSALTDGLSDSTRCRTILINLLLSRPFNPSKLPQENNLMDYKIPTYHWNWSGSWSIDVNTPFFHSPPTPLLNISLNSFQRKNRPGSAARDAMNPEFWDFLLCRFPGVPWKEEKMAIGATVSDANKSPPKCHCIWIVYWRMGN